MRLNYLVLSVGLLLSGSVFADGYTVRQYGVKADSPSKSPDVLNKELLDQVESKQKPNVVFEGQFESNEAELSNEDLRESWMLSAGRNEAYHDDMEKFIATQLPRAKTPKSGIAYASISSADGNQVYYSGPAVNYGKSKTSISADRNTYDIIIESMAAKYGVSKGLIKAVMHTESSFNRYAVSPVGAQGLMQLMPATARRFNVRNSYDPQQNIEAGTRYLSWLIKRFNGDVRLALAGYNAGEGNVDKYGGIPPFKETQNYVSTVLSRYHGLYKNI